MFPAENLRDWRGHKVIDPGGGRIGDLEAVYVDTTTDEPSFATVRIGMIGRHRLVFVPLTGATVTPCTLLPGHAPLPARDAEGMPVPRQPCSEHANGSSRSSKP
jgi:hypothetical protein